MLQVEFSWFGNKTFSRYCSVWKVNKLLWWRQRWDSRAVMSSRMHFCSRGWFLHLNESEPHMGLPASEPRPAQPVSLAVWSRWFLTVLCLTALSNNNTGRLYHKFTTISFVSEVLRLTHLVITLYIQNVFFHFQVF